MEPDVDTVSTTGTLAIEPPAPIIAPRLTLYKAYFDDSTLSDLTIELRNRSVRVHRIVLCRGSEHFAKLLTSPAQGDQVKKIELLEDGSEAMIALLRYLYGLPYPADLAEWHDGKTLLPHALVYTAALKYQTAPFNLIRDISDLCSAINTIVSGTDWDEDKGPLILKYCVENLVELKNVSEFISLLKEKGELGAQIIALQGVIDDSGSDGSHEGDDDEILVHDRDMVPIEMDEGMMQTDDAAASTGGDDYCEGCQTMTQLVCSRCKK